MAPPSPDMKPPSPKEYGDTSLGIQQEHQQMTAPDSPAKMSAARDTSDGTGATPKKDLTHVNQQLSKAKMAPTLETPDAIASVTDEKHLLVSTPVSPDGRIHFPDKVTDGAPSYPDSPPSEVLVSSANQLDSLHDSAGTRFSPEVTSHDAESTCSGKTSLIPTSANGISSTDGAHVRGSTAVSLVDSLHSHSTLVGTGGPASRKRKESPSSIGRQLEEAQYERHGRQKMKSSTTSLTSTTTQRSLLGHEPRASEWEKTSKTAQQEKGQLGVLRANQAEAPSSTRKRTARKVNQEPWIDRKIRALQSIVGTNGQFVPCRETAPLLNEADLRLDRFVDTLDLSAMEPLMETFLPANKKATTLLTREIICLAFTTNECAPVLRQWMLECFNDPEMDEHLPFVLQHTDKPPWLEEMEQLASCAMHYGAIVKGKMTFKSKHRQAMISCAKFVRRLVQCITPYSLPYLDKCKFLDMDRFFFRFGAGTLITVYEDLSNQPGKFFTTLLNSPFATGITAEARPLWASLLGLKCANGHVRHTAPVIEVQKAALAIGAAMQEKSRNSKNVNAAKLRFWERPFDAGGRFTGIHKQFHDEANRHAELLVSTNSQRAIATFPKELPPQIDSHKKICTMPTCTNTQNRATIPVGNDIAGTVPDLNENQPSNELILEQEHFAISNGRIVPCRALVADHGNPDPFSEHEELILYKRFKAVVTNLPPGAQEVTKLSSEKWWEFWAKIAEVLPGHGVMDCIAFYVANKEHFQHR